MVKPPLYNVVKVVPLEVEPIDSIKLEQSVVVYKPTSGAFKVPLPFALPVTEILTSKAMAVNLNQTSFPAEGQDCAGPKPFAVAFTLVYAAFAEQKLDTSESITAPVQLSFAGACAFTRAVNPKKNSDKRSSSFGFKVSG